MSASTSLIHTLAAATADVPFAGILGGLFGFALAGALVLLFKPLLTGLARAGVLLVNPRLTKEERIARRYMRNATMIRRMIEASDALSPSHAAELQAMAARA